MICEFLEKKVIARSQHEFALNRADQLPSVPFVTAGRLTPSAAWGFCSAGRWGGWARSCPPPGIAHAHVGFGSCGVALWPILVCTQEQKDPHRYWEWTPHAHTDASVAAAKARSRRTAWLHKQKPVEKGCQASGTLSDSSQLAPG